MAPSKASNGVSSVSILSPNAVITVLGDKIEALLTPLLALDGATLRARRRDKFLEMGRSA